MIGIIEVRDNLTVQLHDRGHADPLVSISECYMVCYKALRCRPLSDLRWVHGFHGKHVLIFIWPKQGTAW